MSEIGKHVLPGTVRRRETEKSIAFERRPPLIAIGESRPRSLLVNEKKKKKKRKEKKEKEKGRKPSSKATTKKRNLEYPRFYFLYYNLNVSIRNEFSSPVAKQISIIDTKWRIREAIFYNRRGEAIRFDISTSRGINALLRRIERLSGDLLADCWQIRKRQDAHSVERDGRREGGRVVDRDRLVRPIILLVTGR